MKVSAVLVAFVTVQLLALCESSDYVTFTLDKFNPSGKKMQYQLFKDRMRFRQAEELCNSQKNSDSSAGLLLSTPFLNDDPSLLDTLSPRLASFDKAVFDRTIRDGSGRLMWTNFRIELKRGIKAIGYWNYDRMIFHVPGNPPVESKKVHDWIRQLCLESRSYYDLYDHLWNGFGRKDALVTLRLLPIEPGKDQNNKVCIHLYEREFDAPTDDNYAFLLPLCQVN